MMTGDELTKRVAEIGHRVEGPAVLPTGRPSMVQRLVGVKCPLCGRRDYWPYFTHGAGACMDCRAAAVRQIYDEIDKFYKSQRW